MAAPDTFALMVAHWRHFGADDPAYGLMHDVIFRVPGVGPTMAKLGAVPAHPGNAVALLEARESFKPETANAGRRRNGRRRAV